MIYLGSDHGGFDLKEKIKKWLTAEGFAWEDLGNTLYEKEDNYPQFAFAVAEKVVSEEKKLPMDDLGLRGINIPWKQRPKGILCCRSGAGMSIAANKVKGARVIAAFDPRSAKQSRLHNDANILALGSDWLEEYQVKKILSIWLTTEFTGEERHVRRLKQIQEFEENRTNNK